MNFLDAAKIYVRSGDGGNGCVSFRRERFVEFGGPDGGNGGKGGAVWVESVMGLSTLAGYRYRRHFKAKSGRNGMGRRRSGAKGSDVVIKVPMGTEILAEDGESLIVDMLDHGQRFLLAAGGNGGFGNWHFKTSTNRAPRRANPGLPGKEMCIWLSLKLLSDVGLIGLPNAGKSAFISTATSARSKVANYPFTTLHPVLGVVRIRDEEFVLADFPGLIAGSYANRGLGHRFLAHVERCRVLLHIVDGTSSDVAQAYTTVRRELSLYNDNLVKMPEITVISKADELSDTERHRKGEELQKVSAAVPLFCSSLFGENVDRVLEALLQVLVDEKGKTSWRYGNRHQSPTISSMWQPSLF